MPRFPPPGARRSSVVTLADCRPAHTLLITGAQPLHHRRVLSGLRYMAFYRGNSVAESPAYRTAYRAPGPDPLSRVTVGTQAGLKPILTRPSKPFSRGGAARRKDSYRPEGKAVAWQEHLQAIDHRGSRDGSRLRTGGKTSRPARPETPLWLTGHPSTDLDARWHRPVDGTR